MENQVMLWVNQKDFISWIKIQYLQLKDQSLMQTKQDRNLFEAIHLQSIL